MNIIEFWKYAFESMPFLTVLAITLGIGTTYELIVDIKEGNGVFK